MLYTKYQDSKKFFKKIFKIGIIKTCFLATNQDHFNNLVGD